MVLVLAAVAGGGAGAATVASGAADEFSLGVRSSRGHQAEVRFRGSNDSLNAEFRLRSLGYHPTRLDSQSDTACDQYADGEAQRYLMTHRCVSLNRTLIEIREKNYAVRFATATIEMPDYASAEGLSALLTKSGGGDIIPLFQKTGDTVTSPSPLRRPTPPGVTQPSSTSGFKESAAPLAPSCSPTWV